MALWSDENIAQLFKVREHLTIQQYLLSSRCITNFHLQNPKVTQKFIKVNRDTLQFRLSTQRDDVISNDDLAIENLSQAAKVRVKIKCTSPFSYIVKPYQFVLRPRQFHRINIRAVRTERQLELFNMDKFEVLARPQLDGQIDDPSSWTYAQRQRIHIKMVSDLPMKNMNYFSSLGFINNDSPHDQHEQLMKLDVECRQLEAKIQSVRNSSESQTIIKPANLIIVGVISFILGYIFA